MNGRLCGKVLLAAFLLVSFLRAQIPFPTPSDAAVPENSSAFGKRERTYTMNVSVELIPVILHPSWKNVGGGRIGWIEGPEGEKGLELLIGSDHLARRDKLTDGVSYQSMSQVHPPG
jgi:hypothetical protein